MRANSLKLPINANGRVCLELLLIESSRTLCTSGRRLPRIMALLKCLRWLSGSESPLNEVMDGIVNRFGSGAHSTSSVKGEQSTRSISLRRASSVLPLS
ncbi:unnamed protein product [Prunus armeniaca]